MERMKCWNRFINIEVSSSFYIKFSANQMRTHEMLRSSDDLDRFQLGNLYVCHWIGKCDSSEKKIVFGFLVCNGNFCVNNSFEMCLRLLLPSRKISKKLYVTTIGNECLQTAIECCQKVCNKKENMCTFFCHLYNKWNSINYSITIKNIRK